MARQTKLLTSAEIEIIKSQKNKVTYGKLAEQYGVSVRTIGRVMSGEMTSSVDGTDEELILENVRLAKQKQRLQDTQRVERKAFREYARVENAVEELNKELISVIRDNPFHPATVKHYETGQEPIGVVHLTDNHFGEQVHLESNVFNFSIASKRLHKHVETAKKYFNAFGVKRVLVAMTGDMLNSDRRLDEVLENASNRSKTAFIAADIIGQVIQDLNKEFNVSVASITGNEGRVNKDLGWISTIASDNYDLVIHNILSYQFKDCEGVDFFPIRNPLEQVVSLNGTNILLIHGHNGLAKDARIETETAKVMARYANIGVQVHYVICGHIHKANVSDYYSRSGGLVGGNAFSEGALNLLSKASQNLYLFWGNGSRIDSLKVDLQEVEGFEGYTYDESLESYHHDKEISQNGVVVFQVVI